jgi:hypothetical protein
MMAVRILAHARAVDEHDVARFVLELRWNSSGEVVGKLRAVLHLGLRLQLVARKATNGAD